MHFYINKYVKGGKGLGLASMSERRISDLRTASPFMALCTESQRGDGVGEGNLSELKEETRSSERAAVQLALHDITDITDDRRLPPPLSLHLFTRPLN